MKGTSGIPTIVCADDICMPEEDDPVVFEVDVPGWRDGSLVIFDCQYCAHKPYRMY